MTEDEIKQLTAMAGELGGDLGRVHREIRRREHHHEIFKLVLDHTLARGFETVEQMGLTTPDVIIAMCRKYADLAYPKESG